MTEIRFSLRWGHAPSDALVEEWDWSEDEDGFRYKSYYTLIHEENVTLRGTNEGTAPAEVLSELLDGFRDESTYNALQLTLSSGGSFIATAWGFANEQVDQAQAFINRLTSVTV